MRANVFAGHHLRDVCENVSFRWDAEKEEKEKDATDSHRAREMRVANFKKFEITSSNKYVPLTRENKEQKR